MVAKIFRLFDRTQSAKQWSARDALKEALAQITERKVPETSKCLIIFLDNADYKYDFTSIQCGMNSSEMVSLLEVAKQSIVNEIIGDK